MRQNSFYLPFLATSRDKIDLATQHWAQVKVIYPYMIVMMFLIQSCPLCVMKSNKFQAINLTILYVMIQIENLIFIGKYIK